MLTLENWGHPISCSSEKNGAFFALKWWNSLSCYIRAAFTLSVKTRLFIYLFVVCCSCPILLWKTLDCFNVLYVTELTQTLLIAEHDYCWPLVTPTQLIPRKLPSFSPLMRQTILNFERDSSFLFFWNSVVNKLIWAWDAPRAQQNLKNCSFQNVQIWLKINKIHLA